MERNGHAQQQYQNTNSNAYNPYTSTSDPYAPPVHDTTTAYAQPTYKAYTPPQPTNSYLPPSKPAVAPSNTAYSPYAYAPSTTQQGAQPQYTYPAGQSAYNANANTTPLIQPSSVSVPPPVPTTISTITHPKLSNAYNPPFPTATKSSRRSARTGSGQHSHGYSSYEPMSPSVPPIL